MVFTVFLLFLLVAIYLYAEKPGQGSALSAYLPTMDPQSEASTAGPPPAKYRTSGRIRTLQRMQELCESIGAADTACDMLAMPCMR